MVNYSQDRENLFKWAMGVLCTLAVSILGMIYGEVREVSEFMIKTQVDVQYMKEKNSEQDKRLDIHDAILFIKPGETSIKKK